ncbi:MAG: hypothetical protein GF355_09830 [Candidatus Eisenbacteria bacterium]|nr:hypothetical protein [Candidatus Eisenbacteria bacterium]
MRHQKLVSWVLLVSFILLAAPAGWAPGSSARAVEPLEQYQRDDEGDGDPDSLPHRSQGGGGKGSGMLLAGGQQSLPSQTARGEAYAASEWVWRLLRVVRWMKGGCHGNL